MRVIGVVLTCVITFSLADAAKGSEHLRLLSEDELLSQCVAECEPPHVKQSRVSLCKRYNKMRPQPKMFRVCDSAMRSVYEDACREACGFAEEQGATACSQLVDNGWYNEKLSAQCDRFSEMLPRPLLQNICEHGHSRGFKAGCAKATRTMKRLRLEEDSKQVLLEHSAEEGSETATPVNSAPAEPDMPLTGLRGAEGAVLESNTNIDLPTEGEAEPIALVPAHEDSAEVDTQAQQVGEADYALPEETAGELPQEDTQWAQ